MTRRSKGGRELFLHQAYGTCDQRIVGVTETGGLALDDHSRSSLTTPIRARGTGVVDWLGWKIQAKPFPALFSLKQILYIPLARPIAVCQISGNPF